MLAGIGVVFALLVCWPLLNLFYLALVLKAVVGVFTPKES